MSGVGFHVVSDSLFSSFASVETELFRPRWSGISTPLTAILFAILFVPRAFAEEPLPSVERLKTSPVLQHLKPNTLSSPARTPAEQTVAQMYLPEGFRAELVVAEPDLHQPIAFAFDERGRIWVAEAYSYPQKRLAGQGLDKIVIFEDRDGDGKFETRKVFAEGLNLVSGLEVGYGGVWVGAAPELLFIPDRNHDDVPDGPPEVLLDGFGYQDMHECLNSFLWGPDGWLYGNQGVFNLAHIGRRCFVRQICNIDQERLQTTQHGLDGKLSSHFGVTTQHDIFIQQPPRLGFFIGNINFSVIIRELDASEREQKILGLLKMAGRVLVFNVIKRSLNHIGLISMSLFPGNQSGGC